MSNPRAAYASERGPGYARWYMEQMRFPHVAAAWAGGYFREMRDYLTREASLQALNGWDQPKVEIPRELIDGWRASADAAKARVAGNGMGRPLSEALAELGATIRGGGMVHD